MRLRSGEVGSLMFLISLKLYQATELDIPSRADYLIASFDEQQNAQLNPAHLHILTGVICDGGWML